MNRGVAILVAGLAGAAVAYAGCYLLGTSTPRTWLKSPQPELAWLKQEFNLTDSELARVSGLHAAYLPQCREMCQRIDEQNHKLHLLVRTAASITPEIESVVAEAARLRGECQRNMLRHFFEVSRTMPPEQGKRYLSWVREMTFPSATSMAGHAHDSHP